MPNAPYPIVTSIPRLTSRLAGLVGGSQRLGAVALSASNANRAAPTSNIPHNAFQPAVVARQLSDHVNTHELFSHSQKIAIQVTACVLAGISFFSSIVIMYWFLRMRKRFRHRLIMILIIADVIRSFWLFIFPIVSITEHSVQSTSKFCQASGFFTQMGIETADFAILTIAIHTALQVFKPRVERFSTEETGLFRHRYKVYVFCAVIPPLLSSLAYIRSSTEGYMSTAVFCSLPLRPFWYRLAISWIPRYVIMLVVLALYIAVYVHVSAEFRVIGWLGLQASTASGAVENSTNGSDPPNSLSLPQIQSKRGSKLSERSKTSTDAKTSMDKFRGLFGHRPSVQTDTTSTNTPTTTEPLSLTEQLSNFQLNVPGRNIAHSSEAGNLDISPVSNKASDGCIDYIAESRFQKMHNNPGSTGDPSSPATRNADTARIGSEMMSSRMRERHSATQRQLRNLFIYPVCYFLIWLIPFVYHLTTYSNELAQNPVFVLVLLSYLCISSMGAVDSLIFSLRERPWRHIPNSDGTFLGSFRFWKYRAQNSEPQSRNSKNTSTGDTTNDVEKSAKAEAEAQSSENSEESKDSYPTDSGMSERKDFASSGKAAKRPALPRSVSSPTTVDRELYWIDRRLSAALHFKRNQRD